MFGWRGAFLLAVLLPVAILASALTVPIRNRIANRTIAALLVVLAGVATPWMIGFAGFYDRWQWLSYVPFSVNLAVPPLLWLFTHALTRGRWPRGAVWHLVPAARQAFYKIGQAVFPFEPTIGTLFDLTLAFGAVVYGAMALATLRRYRTELADLRSDDALYAARWLGRAIVATLALLTIAIGYKIVGQFVPLGYEGNMGLYIAVALVALYLGIEGWRQAALDLPIISPSAIDSPLSPPGRDWRGLGEEIAARVRAEGWETEPELTLFRLAELAGTNTAYLSRALNEGLGMNFSTFVNGLRSERVAVALEAGSDKTLLNLAMEAGFASKATFNRSFAARYGCSPSTFRERLIR